MPPGRLREANETLELEDPQEFSFSDLQRLQFIEEKAKETLLVLKINVNILTDLKQYYKSLVDSEGWPKDLIRNGARNIHRFETRLDSFKSNIHMQQLRVETLLQLLTDRKSLVHPMSLPVIESRANVAQLYGILKYQSMKANKKLTEKAQLSTDSMEIITQDMHTIAQKTKQETVSMKIITLVTLFFLPGTFISVSHSLIGQSSARLIINTDSDEHWYSPISDGQHWAL